MVTKREYYYLHINSCVRESIELTFSVCKYRRFHGACVDITDEIANVMELKNEKYFCDPCTEIMKGKVHCTVIHDLRKLQELSDEAHNVDEFEYIKIYNPSSPSALNID